MLALFALTGLAPAAPAVAQEPIQQLRAYWVDALNPGFYAPSTGMLQGIAIVAGEVAGGAKVSLIRDGVWLKAINAAGDGWFGTVELPPGAYTIAITHPDGRQEWRQAAVRPGLVTSL